MYIYIYILEYIYYDQIYNIIRIISDMNPPYIPNKKHISTS